MMKKCIFRKNKFGFGEWCNYVRTIMNYACVKCVECGSLYPAESNSLFCCPECRENWLKKNK